MAEVTPDMFAAHLDHELPQYAMVGCYTLIYYTADNATLCAKCATVERTKDYTINPLQVDVYYEGPTLQCDECGRDLESGYGDPEAEVTR